MNTFALIVLAATLLVSFGVLIGCERLLAARTRRPHFGAWRRRSSLNTAAVGTKH
jgi:hypothetical protein